MRAATGDEMAEPFVVEGPIAERWHAWGGAEGAFGAPTGPAQADR
ncbi:hypothetical protein [Frankia nepalensis]|nr:hypothetical protein [Frankia nepalensis]